MAIFRGISGAGDSTTDATVTEVTQQATNAAASASAAASSASSAASSASSASTSATNAATSESNASASASAASTAQTNAETAETNAEAAQAAAEAARDATLTFGDDLTVSASTLSEGASATATYDSETLTIAFGIPVGATGATGATGPAGADGVDGADGADGAGVPVGGTTGQALTKIDGTNYNTQWTTLNTANWDTAYGWGDHSTEGYLTAETNDLTAAVTWANVPDANITQTSVTQHQAALSITEGQISNLGSDIVLDSDIGVTVQGYDADTVKYDDVNPSFTDTGAIKVPTGNTAQQPGTPVAGQFRFNSETGQFEGYNGTAWGAIAGGSGGAGLQDTLMLMGA